MFDTLKEMFIAIIWVQATGCEDILVPMATWDLEGRRMGAGQADLKQSLDAIMRYSIFQACSSQPY